MTLMLVSLAVLMFGGIMAALTAGAPCWSTRFGVAGAVLGTLCGLVPAVDVLLTGRFESIYMPWSAPGGSLHLGLDALSAFFLLPILGLGALCAVYGAGYLQGDAEPKRVGASWFHYNLLLASMVTVVLARNAVLFLMAWETMALASFFLVLFDSDKAAVRMAGWIYMIATHLGAAFLLALFVVLGRQAGSFEFSAFAQAGATLPAALTGMLFLFALIGFGAKAGFIPVHVWLPEAHPAAPSHVSALMSGVMIKTGIYGLLRILSCLGAPPPWWGWTLVAVGAVSAVLGVLLALAQHDLKRLLAYSSVENVGIITVGLGVGYLGMAHGLPGIAVLGFAGALLHVLNHAVFKGLLFLGAGAIRHSTGTGRMDQLGGLLKRMPWTGTTFLVGAAAISGLPPLNGFVSEFLVYLSVFKAVVASPGGLVVVGLVVVASLALVGGLAAACFSRVFGMVFLGQPRTEPAASGGEVSWLMAAPMAVLAVLCVLIGLFSPTLVPRLAPAIDVLVKGGPGMVRDNLQPAVFPLSWLVLAALGLVLLMGLLAGLRKALLRHRCVAAAGTWDCGYAQPTARMQYTASSYAQPFTAVFGNLLQTRRTGKTPEGLFPAAVAFATKPADLFLDFVYRPVFVHATLVLDYLRRTQHGHIQLYVLCIALTLLALLIFGLG